MSISSAASATPEARGERWPVMDLNQVAYVTHRSRRTVERWIASGDLPVAWRGQGRGRTYVWIKDVEKLRKKLCAKTPRNGINHTTAIID